MLEIKNKYDSIPKLIDTTVNTFFKISDAAKMLEEINFLGNKLHLKEYLIEKTKKCDFYEIIKSYLNHIYKQQFLNCPCTSGKIERCFSTLNKVLEIDRGFGKIM